MKTQVKSYPHVAVSSAAQTKTYYAWLVLGFCALFLFYKYVLQVSPSVMTDDLMRHFHVSGAGLGNLAAMFFYAYMITQVFVGPLLDKYSPRLLTAVAIGLSGMGALCFAKSQTLLDASLARALVGVGAAFATVSYMKMAAVWFKPSQYAFVGGLLATAAMVGSMAGQAPLAVMVTHLGWRSSLFYCGAFGLVLAVLFYLFVRDHCAQADSNAMNAASMPASESLTLGDFISVLKKKHNWLLMFYSGLAFSPLAVFGGLWGNPFLQEADHLSRTQAASLTSLMFFGLAIGGPVLGMLSDRLGKRFIVMFFGVLLSFVSLTMVIYMPQLSTLLTGTALFLFGFGTGAFMLGFTMGKETNAPALAATVIGLINTGDALFGAFSEPLVGKVLDVFWKGKVVKGVHYFSVHDYHLALMMLPLYLLLALAFLLMLKRQSGFLGSTKAN